MQYELNPDSQTNYKVGDIENVIEKIKEIKNVVIRAQDYESAAYFRMLEKYYVEKLEKDKTRTI